MRLLLRRAIDSFVRDQILLALAHIHSHNVLHRDIKPGNLFLNKWKDIKIGDFGLSTVRKNKKKQHQTPVGTMGYAAPELLKGKAYNEKSDMYALGCCLYEILTLRSVYDDEHDGCFPMPIPSVRSGLGLGPIPNWRCVHHSRECMLTFSPTSVRRLI